MQSEAKENRSNFHGVLKDSFELGDLNMDGVLDAAEFKTLVKKVGLDWNSPRIQNLFEKFDLNRDGFIQPEEWQVALLHALRSGCAHSRALEAEAEEADETGYSGMLQDSQSLLAKLHVLLDE